MKVGEKYKYHLRNMIIIVTGIRGSANPFPYEVMEYRNGKWASNAGNSGYFEHATYLGLTPLSEFLEAKGETYRSVARAPNNTVGALCSDEAINMLRGKLTFSPNTFPITLKACAEYLGLEPDDLIEMIKLDQPEHDINCRTIMGCQFSVKSNGIWHPLSEVIDAIGINWVAMSRRIFDQDLCSKSNDGLKHEVLHAVRKDVRKRESSSGIQVRPTALIEFSKHLGLEVEDVVNMVKAEEGDDKETDDITDSACRGFVHVDLPPGWHQYGIDFANGDDYTAMTNPLEPGEKTHSINPADWNMSPIDLARLKERLESLKNPICIANGWDYPYSLAQQWYLTQESKMYKFNEVLFKKEYRETQVQDDPERILEDNQIVNSLGVLTNSLFGSQIRSVLDRDGEAHSVANILKVLNDYFEKVDDEGNRITVE